MSDISNIREKKAPNSFSPFFFIHERTCEQIPSLRVASSLFERERLFVTESLSSTSTQTSNRRPERQSTTGLGQNHISNKKIDPRKEFTRIRRHFSTSRDVIHNDIDKNFHVTEMEPFETRLVIDKVTVKTCVCNYEAVNLPNLNPY